MDIVAHKNNSARAACAVEIAGGRKNRTVKPPRSPWAITVLSATTPNQRSQRGTRAIHNQQTRAIVRAPTHDAMSR
jgi:hypothetical protein